MLDNIGESEGEEGSIKVYNLNAGQHDPKWPNLEKIISFCKQTADDVNKLVGKKVHDHFNRNRIETRFSPCHVINPGAIQPHNGHHPYYQA